MSERQIKNIISISDTYSFQNNMNNPKKFISIENDENDEVIERFFFLSCLHNFNYFLLKENEIDPSDLYSINPTPPPPLAGSSSGSGSGSSSKLGSGVVCRPEGCTLRAGFDIDTSEVICRLECNQMFEFDTIQLLHPVDEECIPVERQYTYIVYIYLIIKSLF